jgi:hypothetical protein
MKKRILWSRDGWESQSDIYLTEDGKLIEENGNEYNIYEFIEEYAERMVSVERTQGDMPFLDSDLIDEYFKIKI